MKLKLCGQTDTASRLYSYVYLFPLIQLRAVLKFYCHQRVVLRSCSFPLSSSTKLLLVVILFHVRYMIHAPYPLLFDHINLLKPSGYFTNQEV